MVSGPIKIPPNPYRKASFRETARDIVSADRHNRKYGKTVDTAGAIANAMERAYKLGANDAYTGDLYAQQPQTSETIEWRLIPPRPRTAFWTICLWTQTRGDREGRAGRLIPGIRGYNTACWRFMVDGGQPTTDTYGARTIKPLVDLQLLMPSLESDEHLVVSARGIQAWADFLARGGTGPDDLC